MKTILLLILFTATAMGQGKIPLSPLILDSLCVERGHVFLDDKTETYRSGIRDFLDSSTALHFITNKGRCARCLQNVSQTRVNYTETIWRRKKAK